jgi:hypothetical protein
LAGRAVTNTIELSATSAAAGAVPEQLHGGGTAVERSGVIGIEIDLWLQRIAGVDGIGREQLQISRRLVRVAGGIAWPHVSVATLHGTPGRRPWGSESLSGRT